MEKENIVVKNVKLEFIATKTDNYDNELSYFKIKDKTIEKKMAEYITEDFKIPWFSSDSGKSKILKVKQKYVKLKNLNRSDAITVEITFKEYKMEDICGFYVSSLK